MSEPTIPEIIGACAAAFGASETDILSRRNDRASVFCRHAAVYLARKLTGKSYPQIAMAFGSHHTTVLAACRMAEARMRTLPEYSSLVSRAEKLLPAPAPSSEIDRIALLNALREAEVKIRQAANLLQRQIRTDIANNGDAER